MYYRAEQTREAIMSAFLELSDEKPIGEITAAEVCARAGLNRTTFYRYFKSPNDIGRELERRWLDRIRTLFETRDPFEESTIREIFDLFDKEKRFLKYEKGPVPSPEFLKELAKLTTEYAMPVWREKIPNAAPEEAGVALDMLSFGTLHAIFFANDQYERELIIRNLLLMREGCIRMYAEGAAGNKTEKDRS